MKPQLTMNKTTVLLIEDASGYFLQLCESLEDQVQYRDQSAHSNSVLKAAVLLLEELRRVRRVPVRLHGHCHGLQLHAKQPDPC